MDEHGEWTALEVAVNGPNPDEFCRGHLDMVFTCEDAVVASGRGENRDGVGVRSNQS